MAPFLCASIPPIHSGLRKFERIVALAAASLLGACASGPPTSGGGPGAPAPTAAVERFLQLARDKDYVAMGWVFGTESGPVIRRDPVGEVEERMYALASLLEHDAFELGDGSSIPGRAGEALRFNVSIQRGSRTRQVPFTVVRGPQGRWFVEQLDVRALTE